jgi:hypothetical protein
MMPCGKPEPRYSCRTACSFAQVWSLPQAEHLDSLVSFMVDLSNMSLVFSTPVKTSFPVLGHLIMTLAILTPPFEAPGLETSIVGPGLLFLYPIFYHPPARSGQRFRIAGSYHDGAKVLDWFRSFAPDGEVSGLRLMPEADSQL